MACKDNSTHTTAAPAAGNDSAARANFIEGQVKQKYERMLHPPLTYLGDAFKYREADGKFYCCAHCATSAGANGIADHVDHGSHPGHLIAAGGGA